MSNIDGVWARARDGFHSVVIGGTLAEPPQNLRVVRVSCDVPTTTLGPLLEARRKIERILGAKEPLVEMARTRVMTGLRRHLLGDSATSEGSLVEVYNRLAALEPSALVLDAADSADPATLDMLRHILARPGWLRLPVVLVLRNGPREDAISALVDTVRRASAEGPFVRPSPQPIETPPAMRRVDRTASVGLAPAVLRVLRTLALVGSGCEASLLAAVLEVHELEVLEALQLAADGGIPIEDRGEGRFYLPAEEVAALRREILPSLAASLHGRIAAVLEHETPAPDAPMPELVLPSEEPADKHPEPTAAARPSDPWEVMASGPPPSMPTPEANGTNDEEAPGDGSDDGAGIASVAAVEPPLAEAPPYYRPFSGEPVRAEVPPARHRAVPRPTQSPKRADEARAASHLEAAGDEVGAIERYFIAAQRAAAAGAYPQAVAHTNAAVALLDRQPFSEARRVQRAELLLLSARLQWHGGGVGGAFTLQSALRVADSARACLRAGDPPDLVVELVATTAAILYDIGDLDSLSRALGELSSASRALGLVGAPRAAARLFNDQASVLLRAGDPVRAAHLLSESKKLFEATSKDDPIAMAEMAECDHLFARILLHVPARPGREADALSLGLDHAIAAERAFKRLGVPREVTRVLETMGRIELRKGRLERAAERLTTAARTQETIGDLVGLARSTAALSEVMICGGQLLAGLGLLADSVELNFEKGSRLGLAYNRHALELLLADEIAMSSHHEVLSKLRARVAELEAKLGRTEIPGSAGTVHSQSN